MHQWIQNYDPFHHAWLSTAAAAAPVLLLFYLLAVRKTAAHLAAVAALGASVLLAGAVFGMPWIMVTGAVANGALYGGIQIAWTLAAAVFVYDLTVESGHFEIIKDSLGNVTTDRRLQVLLIALAFGAVLEGAGGGGAPVAVAGAMMVGLGFAPFPAAVLCLIANTAPVAFGGVGNPVRVLVAVTGLGEADLSAMIGRILPWTALALPFWLVRSMTSWKNTVAVWPGLLACGGVFAAMQFYWSNFRDAALVDIVGGMVTLLALTLFLKAWHPREVWHFPEEPPPQKRAMPHSAGQVLHAWSPFLLLSIFVVLWGMPPVKRLLDRTTLSLPVAGLHLQSLRVPPVVAVQHAEPAFFDFPWLAAVGTATFVAGLISGPLLGLSPARTMRVFVRTCHRMRFSLLAILAMLALGYVTRYSGMDAVMGLAMTQTGSLFPFFGTLLGWLGVALTGTDAGSNALFGSLQVITANRLELSPVLMAAANSAGGVMGKMIGAQSIIVACVAVGQEGKEGDLFRAVLPHSIALASVIGLIVYWYAYFGQSWIPAGRVWGG
ncbi:MAG TPA: lactate permease LctP family transporter [Bryobacteraceae bacterium]|nr:lactate permease LctP family transporter [Bryobacteraceae bacterium]